MDVALTIASIIALAAFCLAPVVLIVIGFVRLRTKNGFYYFLAGIVIAMLLLVPMLSAPLGNLICYLLSHFGVNASFEDTYVLDLALVVFGSYLSIRLYRWIENRKSKSYIAYAKKFISAMEDPEFPSCSNILISTLTDVIDKTPKRNLPSNTKRAVEIEICKIASHFLGSSDYRDIFGDLTEHGYQFLSISLNCLDHFLNNDYITSKEYDSMCEELKSQLESTAPIGNCSSDEPIYYMEAANGMTVRVPESKLEEWTAQQDAIRNGTDTPEQAALKRRLVESIVNDLYGDPEEE